jgi:release factor glutamine methyltransferase
MRQRNYIQKRILQQRRLFRRYRSVPEGGMQIEHFNIRLIIRRNVFWPNDDSIPLLQSIQIKPGNTVLDVGTGCGVVGIFCALKGAGAVTGLDWNLDAVANAKENVTFNGVGGIVKIEKSDMFNAVRAHEGYDLIVANLPMMNVHAHDVVESSIWDSDLHANRAFLSGVGEFIKPGGRVYMTQGDFAAIDEVKSLAKEHGWRFEQRKTRRSSAGDTFFAVELVRIL